MEPFIPLISLATLAALVIIALAALKAWHGWLALKHRELDLRAPEPGHGIAPATRIDIANLKERIRKLEAIAAGVDL